MARRKLSRFVCAPCALLVKRFVVVGIENVKKRKSKIHCALAGGKRRETKFQRYGHARIAISGCARARCSDTRKQTHARARARFRGCSNFCRCINTVEKQPPSAGSATFPWACVSPQLFAVYTLLWASARVFVHASFNTRVNGLDQPAIFDFCNRKIERLLGNF